MNKMGIATIGIIAVAYAILLMAYIHEEHAKAAELESTVTTHKDVEDEVLGVEYTTEEYRRELQDVTTLSCVRPRCAILEDLPLLPTFQIEIQELCDKYSVDYALILAIMDRETGGTFNTAIDRTREHVGAMQISTHWFKKKAKEMELDMYDELDSIELGISYLRELLEKYEGEPALAVMSYNMGEGRATELYRKGYINKYTESVMRSRDIYETRLNEEG